MLKECGRMGQIKKIIGIVVVSAFLLSACGLAGSTRNDNSSIRVLAVESFLADIAQNIAGDRAVVETLVPEGVDPHSFDPSPRDIARLADAQIVIINGAGLESWFSRMLGNAEGERLVIEASAGLETRKPAEGELGQHSGETTPGSSEVDPHFWLDPVLVVRYVENIRDGLTQADPGGKDIYNANASAYIKNLEALDSWIKSEVEVVQPENRLLVTNHESFGYFADRYGFKVVGTLIPSTSTEASPSAQQLAQLIDEIKATGAKAVFLESGVNPELADQIARETGIRVVTGLNTHSIGQGGAGSYIEMMEQNVRLIVEALR